MVAYRSTSMSANSGTTYSTLIGAHTMNCMTNRTDKKCPIELVAECRVSPQMSPQMLLFWPI